MQLLKNGIYEIADGWGEIMKSFSTEVGIKGRGNDFDDFDRSRLQQVTEGKGKRMEEGLGGIIFYSASRG